MLHMEIMEIRKYCDKTLFGALDVKTQKRHEGVSVPVTTNFPCQTCGRICSFNNTDPIVCCLDSRPPQSPNAENDVASTTRRPSGPVSSTTEYVPPLFEDEYEDQSEKCKDIPSFLTTKKIGKKSFDKCIEYQEKYVYPCEQVMSLTGLPRRSNHCHRNADELIIGGPNAAQYEFPHMVMLGYGDKIDELQWLCGGALISERYILMAGHCNASRDLGPVSHVLVGALRSDESELSKVYKVKRIIKHPEYKPPVKYNDIALLETEKQIKLDQFTVPACLHTGGAVNDSEVIAIGWGLTEYSGSTSQILQKVILQKFSTAECSQKYKPTRLIKRGLDDQSQTCYGIKLKDTCQVKTGGPIQIKNQKIHCMYTVVGVASFGRACGVVGVPGVYTKLAHYVPWIESIVWPN